MPDPGKAPHPKANATTWRKGKSGNPAGHTKTPPEVKAFLASVSLEAAQRLMQIVRDSPDDKVAVSAAKVIMEYTVTKPRDVESESANAQVVIDALAAALTGKT